jgi:hypothetical protein
MKAPNKLSLTPETKERIRHGFYIAHNRKMLLDDIERMKLTEAQTYIKLARRAEALAQPIEGIGNRPVGRPVVIIVGIIVAVVIVVSANSLLRLR